MKNQVIREALQKARPHVSSDKTRSILDRASRWERYADEALAAIDAALALLSKPDVEQKAEPVAWMNPDTGSVISQREMMDLVAKRRTNTIERYAVALRVAHPVVPAPDEEDKTRTLTPEDLDQILVNVETVLCESMEGRPKSERMAEVDRYRTCINQLAKMGYVHLKVEEDKAEGIDHKAELHAVRTLGWRPHAFSAPDDPGHVHFAWITEAFKAGARTAPSPAKAGKVLTVDTVMKVVEEDWYPNVGRWMNQGLRTMPKLRELLEAFPPSPDTAVNDQPNAQGDE